MTLYNNVGNKPVFDAAITHNSHGSIVVQDTAGEQIDVMGPLGIFQTKQKWRNK